MFRLALQTSGTLRARLSRAVNSAGSPLISATQRHHSTVPQWGPKPAVGDRVFVAMSGGVDSSVVALLLSQHAETLGGSGSLALEPIFMRNWSTLEESGDFEPGSGGAAGCEWQQEWESVQAVCHTLKLPSPRLVDLSREYWTGVFAPSLEEWQNGRTPNPDVLCNREIKFGTLLDQLIPPSKRNCHPIAGQRRSWLATGHYAKVVRPSPNEKIQLHRADDPHKDQSYFLSSVTSQALSHALFPLAGLTKPEVRKLASDWHLPSAKRKESMGLCFVGKRGKGQQGGAALDQGSQVGSTKQPTKTNTFGAWLSSYLAPSSPYTSPGPIRSAVDGNVLGRHEGLHTLTIGQGARLSGQREKWFVAAKTIRHEVDGSGLDQPEATVLVVPGNSHPLLMCTRIELPIEAFVWISEDGPPARLLDATTGKSQVGVRPPRLAAQVRHRGGEIACDVECIPPANSTVEPQGATLRVSFPAGHRPVAICPGQVLALYDGQQCLGSGVIPDLPSAVRTLGQEQAESGAAPAGDDATALR
ncbi:unnamed protein product [Parajaminaea phylloscopi]